MSGAFQWLRTFLKSAAGIVLDDGKQYFVEARLAPVARRFEAASVEALVLRLDANRDPILAKAVIDALTTNETYFFRDRHPFNLFSAEILPAVMKARANERLIRVWCAGCATGQEPYSLAMILDEAARTLAGWRVELFATDISGAAIEAARNGGYNQFEVQRGLPVNMLLRYFQRDNERWRVVEHIRARVEFQERNLIADFSDLGPFDIVFCRNVLIYFDVATKRDVLSRLARTCRPEAFLLLGAAETVVDLCEEWRPHPAHPTLYVNQPPGSSAARRPMLVASR